MTEKNLLDKILSALYGADEPKLAGQLKEYVADKEDELIKKFSVLAAEALHRLEQYEKEITDYRGLFKYFLYNFKEQDTPLKLFTTDKYRIEDIITKYPEHSPISEYAPNYKTTKTAIDNDRGDDHNYSYMEPPPKKELDKESLTIFASDMYDALLECIEYLEHNEVGAPCLNNAKMLIHKITTP